MLQKRVNRVYDSGSGDISCQLLLEVQKEISVSVEDRLKVYELCKTHLGGHWSDVSADQLVISPRQIRGITQQTVISILMTEINISPKIYTMFENGFISEYIDVSMCRYFNVDDDLNPIAVKLLAQKVAKCTQNTYRLPET
ncbi:unnamed protein product [Oppiella nova]|uniref:Uncharacterized protein n=1 Tax=Oppiella nova TaxID=334625 RepID=A0A7R9LYP4_9ACAR|nr:unnamed protein product [Oppiella nova]CAG2168291.1 unnamed protein product [Oppiella nova]